MLFESTTSGAESKALGFGTFPSAHHRTSVPISRLGSSADLEAEQVIAEAVAVHAIATQATGIRTPGEAEAGYTVSARKLQER